MGKNNEQNTQQNKQSEKNSERNFHFAKDGQHVLRMKMNALKAGVRRYGRISRKAWSSLAVVLGIFAIVIIALFTSQPQSATPDKTVNPTDAGIYVDENLKIQARIPGVQKLSLDLKTPDLQAQVDAQAKQEVRATTATGTAEETPELTVKYPLTRNGAVITEFGIYHQPVLDVWRYHPGVDIRCKKGDRVIAAEEGTVASITESNQESLLITLSHTHGWRTVYGQVGDVSVKVGDTVTKGQTLGLITQSATALEPHLHFEMRLNSKAINPLKFLK